MNKKKRRLISPESALLLRNDYLDHLNMRYLTHHLKRLLAFLVLTVILSPCALRCDTYVNEDITDDTTWTPSGSPYIVQSDITVRGLVVNQTTTLKIEPGTEVRFQAGTGLFIGSLSSRYFGVLDAQGTFQNPIIFTSAESPKNPGDWKGIYFRDQTRDQLTQLNFCAILFAGHTYESGLNFDSASPGLIRHLSIAKGSGYAISASNARFYLEHSNIDDNQLGGINNTADPMLIYAQYNWWGDVSGPSGFGPGTGQSVSDYVKYTPWRGEPFNPNLWFYNIFISPEEISQYGGSAAFRLNISYPSNWTITIQNDSHQTVRTFSGSGTEIREAWSGDDTGGQPLSDGTYTYEISMVKISDPAITASLHGQIVLNHEMSVGRIDYPKLNSLVSNQVPIHGAAKGDRFSYYILRYGHGDNPTSWTHLKTSHTPVESGLLGSWDTTGIKGRNYTIRLDVHSKGGSHATEMVSVRVLSIADLTATPGLFSPNSDGILDSTSLTAFLTYDANWTMRITAPFSETELGVDPGVHIPKDPMQDPDENLVKTYQGAGRDIQEIWDGASDEHMGYDFLTDGNYTIQVTATKSQSLEDFFNPSKESRYGADGNYTVGVFSEIRSVFLDASVPTAVITLPETGEQLSCTADVIGTANDLHFKNYLLKYGAGSNPTNWTTIAGPIYTPVINDTLATWNLENIANGTGVLRLQVEDMAGNIALYDVALMIDNIEITEVSAAPEFINPFLGQAATISMEINRPAKVTLDLYKCTMTIGDYGDGTESESLYMNLINEVRLPEGTHTYVWDGRDQMGDIVEHSVYTYRITAEDDNGCTDVYHPTYVDGSADFTSASVFPLQYDPYRNEPVEIRFTMDAPGWVTIGGEYPARFPRFLLEAAPREGIVENIVVWDGRDGIGNITDFEFLISAKNEIMPQIFTVIADNTLKIQTLQTESYLIAPPYNQISTIHYSISRDADVTITLSDPDRNSWVIGYFPNQPQGSHSVEWDGTNDQGEMVAEAGYYKVIVTAEDVNTNTIVTRTANITVFN